MGSSELLPPATLPSQIVERLVPFKCEELLCFDYNPLTPGALLDKHRCTPSQQCRQPQERLSQVVGVEEEA